MHSLAVIDLNANRFEGARTRSREAVQWQRKALASNSAKPSYRRFLTSHLTKLIDTARGLGHAEDVSEAERELADFRELGASECKPSADSRGNSLNGRASSNRDRSRRKPTKLDRSRGSASGVYWIILSVLFGWAFFLWG